MPPTGLLTPVVSSPTVPRESITPSYLLDILALIGSSKTHGVETTEKPDISDSLWEILVPLLKIVLTHIIEKLN